jgi:hypothetical protein
MDDGHYAAQIIPAEWVAWALCPFSYFAGSLIPLPVLVFVYFLLAFTAFNELVYCPVSNFYEEDCGMTYSGVNGMLMEKSNTVPCFEWQRGLLFLDINIVLGWTCSEHYQSGLTEHYSGPLPDMVNQRSRK